MASYYVTHPNLGISALVDAPSTDKARTTFMDYLERQGQMFRVDRQRWRRNMVAERMEDPDSVSADIRLYYGYSDESKHPTFSTSPSREEMGLPSEQPPAYSQMEMEEPEEWYDRGMEEAMEEEELGGESFRQYAEVEAEGHAAGLPIQKTAREDPQAQKMSPIAKAATRGWLK